MFILTMKEKDEAEGAYAVITKHGEKVLQLFQNEDDAGHSMFSESLKSVNVDSTSLKQIFDD